MPRTVPAEPVFPDDGGAERAVWELLAAQLPEDAVLLHGVHLQHEAREHEIDLLVLWPGVGVAVIEVKGGFVDRVEGVWWQSDGAGRHRIDPVTQVQSARHALQDLLGRHGLARGVRIAHLVALPYRYVPDGWDLGDLPRDMLIDRADTEATGQVAARVRYAVDHRGAGHAPLDDDGAAALVSFLAGGFPSQAEALSSAAEHEERLEQMTRDQAGILRALRHVPRVHVTGGAGTGKTWLALSRARDLTRDGARVALLCYSRGLGRYLQRTAATWPRGQQPAYVGLFHDLPLSWGADRGRDDDPDYWERRLPLALGELAGARPRADLFDAVVVDEAQDFGELWWPSLLRCLREAETGGVYVFSDDAQRVFPRQGAVPLQLVPVSLDENLRSTKQIAQTFGAFTSDMLRPRGSSGLPVRLVDVPAEEAIAAADDAVEALLDEGWPPGQVALLATGRRHPEQVNEVDLGGHIGYWDTFFAAEDVFYGHVLGFKGLERTVVVLAVNGVREAARARELLYTGMSRARALLVVVGDRGWIEEVGGAAVSSRLTRAVDWRPAP